MSLNHKKLVWTSSVIGGIIVILGILWYYQSQGFIKIFPTADDRSTKKILIIDESKFKSAEGLPQEEFTKKSKS